VVDAIRCFLTDLAIEILHSIEAACAATTEAPPRPSSRRGRISKRPRDPETDNITAPIAAESQSFLDNLLAQIERL
jgi:hypothetical protein